MSSQTCSGEGQFPRRGGKGLCDRLSLSRDKGRPGPGPTNAHATTPQGTSRNYSAGYLVQILRRFCPALRTPLHPHLSQGHALGCCQLRESSYFSQQESSQLRTSARCCRELPFRRGGVPPRGKKRRKAASDSYRGLGAWPSGSRRRSPGSPLTARRPGSPLRRRGRPCTRSDPPGP